MSVAPRLAETSWPARSRFARGPSAAADAEKTPASEASERFYRITGPCSFLVAPDEATLGLPSGGAMTAADDPEEWARGLILRYRSPDLAARIVHDDAPLPEGRGRIIAPVHALG